MNETVPPLPRVQHAFVVHVGTRQVHDRGPWSREGEGVSVSIDPQAWTAIARLGGRPWWRVSNPDSRPLSFVDVHAVLDDPDLRGHVQRWAVRCGIAEWVDAWRVTWWDDEMGGDMWTLCRTRAQAQGWGHEDVQPVTVLQFTDRAARRSGADLDVDDLLVVDYATAQLPDADGVWWADRLDVAGLSAPRGVIPADRFAELTVTRLR